MLATNDQPIDTFSMDSDGLPFIIDNSATGGICNEKSLFVGPFKDHSITTETANGTETKIKKVGTLHLQLTDDRGVNHIYDVPGVVYDPDSPYSLLGIPFLSKFFAKDGEFLDDET